MMQKEVKYKVYYSDEYWYIESVLVAGVPIAGIIASLSSNDTIHLERLYVDPGRNNRRKGIGTTLHSHLLHWAELNDVKHIQTEVVPKKPSDYPAVVSFLEDIGYVCVGSFYDKKLEGIRKFGFVLNLN